MSGEIEYKHNSQSATRDSSNLNMDITLLQDLIGEKKIRICELMCGTGRMTIPLALDGHSVTGIEIQEAFANIAREELVHSGSNATIQIADVAKNSWGTEYDLVIVGRDSLLELGTALEQERIISTAFASLKEEGFIFIDNTNIEEVSSLQPPTLECVGSVTEHSSLCFKTEGIKFNKKKKRLSYRYSLYKNGRPPKQDKQNCRPRKGVVE